MLWTWQLHLTLIHFQSMIWLGVQAVLNLKMALVSSGLYFLTTGYWGKIKLYRMYIPKYLKQQILTGICSLAGLWGHQAVYYVITEICIYYTIT